MSTREKLTREQLDSESDTDSLATQDSQTSREKCTDEEEADTSSQLTAQEMRILIAELTSTDEAAQSELTELDSKPHMRLLTREERDEKTNSQLSSQEMRILVDELTPSQK